METFIFIGRSGCGKGTQAKLIIKHLKEKTPETPCFYLETGNSFRSLMAEDSFTGRITKAVSEAGQLQPEFLAVWTWSHLLIENLTGKEHLIIDGCPRRLHEAPVLDSAVSFYGRKNPHVIHINVSREWSKEKLLARKRPDDSIDNIEKRLNWFETEVLPAIYFFKGNPDYQYFEVNGEQTVEEVHTEILSKVESLTSLNK